MLDVIRFWSGEFKHDGMTMPIIGYMTASMTALHLTLWYFDDEDMKYDTLFYDRGRNVIINPYNPVNSEEFDIVLVLPVELVDMIGFDYERDQMKTAPNPDTFTFEDDYLDWDYPSYSSDVSKIVHNLRAIAFTDNMSADRLLG